MTNSSFFSRVVAQLVPYTPGEQPKMANVVKLNTNENPYPPSPKVIATIAQSAAHGLQLYPDPDATALSEAIAVQYRLSPKHVFVGNGSVRPVGFSVGCTGGATTCVNTLVASHLLEFIV